MCHALADFVRFKVQSTFSDYWGNQYTTAPVWSVCTS